MGHIVGDNTAEWDARVRQEQQRQKRLVRRAHIGLGAGMLLGLVAVAFVVTVQAKKPPAAAASRPILSQDENSTQARVPRHESFTHKPGSDELEAQVQTLAVGLARIWRGGKSEEAAATAQSYTSEYERAVGCDLRWVAGRAGPGVWEGTVSLVRSLHEITPFVGRAREGKAVVVTALTCPDDVGRHSSNLPKDSDLSEALSRT